MHTAKTELLDFKCFRGHVSESLQKRWRDHTPKVIHVRNSSRRSYFFNLKPTAAVLLTNFDTEKQQYMFSMKI